jgi:zinc transport system ATP-binding protein
MNMKSVFSHTATRPHGRKSAPDAISRPSAITPTPPVELHTVAIRFSGVSFAHKETRVLDDVSFHVHEGEFVALVGQNGSGKTTLLRLVLGLAVPEAGRIEIFGENPVEARTSVGYVPQNASYDPAFPISVREVVRMGRIVGSARSKGINPTKPTRGEAAVSRALELADVADLENRPYSALSGGQRKRVLVARALASEPRLLVLDEPTANMDVESEKRLYQVLGKLKKTATILIATHDTGFVSALTDTVLCVGEREGKKHNVVRHAAAPADHVPEALYGGEVVRVLHDTDLPDDICCSR